MFPDPDSDQNVFGLERLLILTELQAESHKVMILISLDGKKAECTVLSKKFNA